MVVSNDEMKGTGIVSENGERGEGQKREAKHVAARAAWRAPRN